MHPPQRAFVKGGGNSQQGFTDQKEKEHREQNATRRPGHARKTTESGLLGERDPRQFVETGGAQHPILMFSDAFPAKELPAFRAARDRLAPRMIETTLMNQGGHGRVAGSGLHG